MAKLVKANLDFEGTARILNLPNATTAQEPATLAQLQNAIEGLNWKDDVRVATGSNVNLSSPGASLDGVSLSAGDRFLADNQTDPTENGIYVWNGATSAATRAPDANTGSELNQAVVMVRDGTRAGSAYRQTQVDVTIGTDDILWVSFGATPALASETTAGVAELATQSEVDAGLDDARIITPLKLANWAGRIKKHAQTFGDGSSTQYDITHNIDDDVVVTVKRVSDGAEVICEVTQLSATVVRLNFASAPANNSLRCVVVG